MRQIIGGAALIAAALALAPLAAEAAPRRGVRPASPLRPRAVERSGPGEGVIRWNTPNASGNLGGPGAGGGGGGGSP